jgi:TIR domain
MDIRPAPSGSIFISYRREDASGEAGRLYDRLVERFGRNHVFIDVDSIEPGEVFAEVIQETLAACRVLVAVIGAGWMTATDADGHRRLDSPQDFVRIEIEAALTRGLRVIPVLIEDTPMPWAADLPATLRPLADRHAVRLSAARFGYDSSRLMDTVQRVLDTPGTASRPPGTPVPTTATESSPASSHSRRDPSPASRDNTQELPLDHPSTAATGKPDKSRPVPRPPTVVGRRIRHRRLLRVRTFALPLVLVLAVLTWLGYRRAFSHEPAGATHLGAHPSSGSAAREAIFADDFSETRNDWIRYANGATEGTYDQGAYELSTGTLGDVIAIPGLAPAGLSRVLLQVDARLVSGPVGHGYGVVCRYRDKGNYYWFNITNDGYYGVNKMAGGVYTRLQSPKRSGAIHSSGLNRIQAVCADAAGSRSVELALWVNGRQLVTVRDVGQVLPGGKAGLFGRDNTGGPTTWMFDNFALWRLP